MASVPSCARITRERSSGAYGRERSATRRVLRGARPRSIETRAASAPSADVPVMIPIAHAAPAVSLRLIGRSPGEVPPRFAAGTG